MGYGRNIKTEHNGDKGQGRKSGFYGHREDAKDYSKRRRRSNGRQVIADEVEELTQSPDRRPDTSKDS